MVLPVRSFPVKVTSVLARNPNPVSLEQYSVGTRTHLVHAGVSETRSIRASVAVCGRRQTRVLPPVEVRLSSQPVDITAATRYQCTVSVFEALNLTVLEGIHGESLRCCDG